MADLIVGDWKDFTFHMATVSDHEKIAKHVCENYLKDEPMNSTLGWCDINASEHTELIGLALTHQISYYVTKKGTDEIAAVNILMESTKEGFGFVGMEPKSPHLSKINKFIAKFHETTVHVYHNQKKFDRYVDIFITSVDSKFRGNGIAEEMYRRMVVFLKAKGFQSVQSAFTSFGTRAVVNKLNFTELGRIYFKDYLDENGNQIFKKAKDEEFVAELIKDL